MNRIRVGAIIPMENGFALMHRTNVSYKTPSDYYAFPGGGVEENENLEDAIKREIQEEFGIEIKVEKQLYEIQTDIQKEYFYLCTYIKGEFGTGTGPEFNNDPQYKTNGKYIPEIIKRNNINNVLLLPLEIRNKFINDIEKGVF